MDVEMIQVNPRLGATALLNGDIDFTRPSAPPCAASCRRLSDQVCRRVGEKVRHFLIVRPEIKEIRDLNGKKLGVATLFGSDQSAAEEMIRGKGFSPEHDQADPLGEAPVRAQALRAGWSMRSRFPRPSI